MGAVKPMIDGVLHSLRSNWFLRFLVAGALNTLLGLTVYSAAILLRAPVWLALISRTQDLSARFLMTDIVRSIRDSTVLQTTSDYIVRDFLRPADFHNIIHSLLSSSSANVEVDCYTRAPIDKPGLLAEMQQKCCLCYEITEAPVTVNAAGTKPHYYFLNNRAADFGYIPTRASIEVILKEARAILMPG